MRDLIQGPDIRRKNSDTKIKSLCSNIVYIISKGRVKPGKHVWLGLVVKSLTGSRKVLTILNRYGHSIGYNLIEEIETELAYAAHYEDLKVPPGIDAVDGLSTHLAFDNFDHFVNTQDCKDTLHDTVGIIYQFSAPKTDAPIALEGNESVPLIHSETRVPRKTTKVQ